jgi:hypothetical protein
MSGPVGWITVGATAASEVNLASFSCFRAILRETPELGDEGLPLRVLAIDPRIESCKANFTDNTLTVLTGFFIINMWGEEFTLEPVLLSWGVVAFHAKRRL